MADAVEVLLIGGTSHVGKSALGGRLAEAPGWHHLSTDQLARHPGRPWRVEGSPAPAFVVDYYSRLPDSELLEDVLRHYRQNVWPVAEALVRSHLGNPYDPCLVLEGSAILPDSVQASRLDRCHAVWLTAPDELISERIREASDLDRRRDDERQAILAFRERALRFNELVVESARRSGGRLLDVSSSDPFDELVSRLGRRPYG